MQQFEQRTRIINLFYEIHDVFLIQNEKCFRCCTKVKSLIALDKNAYELQKNFCSHSISTYTFSYGYKAHFNT